MGEREELIVILNFLEAARSRTCAKQKESFRDCIEKKNHRFETCYLRDFNKFMACHIKIY